MTQPATLFILKALIQIPKSGNLDLSHSVKSGNVSMQKRKHDSLRIRSRNQKLKQQMLQLLWLNLQLNKLPWQLLALPAESVRASRQSAPP